MDNLQIHIDNYLTYCHSQKRLDGKTIKAYTIDLKQFSLQLPSLNIEDIDSTTLETCISQLHEQYKPKTVRRKIASLKAFFHYLEYKDILEYNPFNKIRTKFREPTILPKTIPLHTLELLLSTIYDQYISAKTSYQRRNALRDAAVIELLFATGIRISELCSLKTDDINLQERTILVFGKGSKERRIQIGSDKVVEVLNEYRTEFSSEIDSCHYFFVNQSGRALSDQSVRRIINKYTELAHIDLHITPHMFRHTFATSLLEADVDIRYIQQMLGHSSINITEIYTHVTMAKQGDILKTKHPRNGFRV